MRKGWFKIAGVQNGDRALDDQLRGLEHVKFRGHSVLDLGCAEGLIAKHALEQGAAHVDGVEVVLAHVMEARRQCFGYPETSRFFVQDLNKFDPKPLLARYDIVLMLAILHKLRRPIDLLEQVADFDSDWCVVRLPKGDGVIRDERSHWVAYDVPAWFEDNGFALWRTTQGHFDEWMGYFRRLR